MRFQCTFDRRVGAAPAGAAVLGSDAAPTWSAPGPSDRLLASRAVSHHGCEARTLRLALSAPPGAPAIPVSVYLKEELTQSWQLVAGAVTLTPGTLAEVPVPSAFGLDVSEVLDLAIVAADPGGTPDGLYRFAATVSAA